MREILFRGIPTETLSEKQGSFVYGYYEKSPSGKSYIVLPEKLAKSVVQVNENTIGQYTGLNDRNDKKIFEGDIIKFGEWNLLVYFNDECFQYKASKFKNPSGCYEHYEFGSSKWHDIDLGWIAAEIPCNGSLSSEVIGNIYENNELLEENT